MNITEKLRGAMRRIAGVSSPPRSWSKRRTVALPSILNTYGPRADAFPKPTPINLRRFSETPVARKAINTIKDRIAGMRWRIQPRPGRVPGAAPDADRRIQILTDNFDTPNPDDSFRSLSEQVLEDVIVGGFGAIEVEKRAIRSIPWVWPVDGATIRMRSDWDGLPGSPRYVQVTGKSGPEGRFC